jgi:hypothetical protein
MRGWLLIAVAMCGVAVGFTWAESRKPSEEPKPEEKGKPEPGKSGLPAELKEMNQLARQKYNAVIEVELTSLGPVVIFNGDALILRKGKERTVVPVVPNEYALTKSIAHAALGTHSLIVPHANGQPLPDRVITEVKEFRTVVAKCPEVVEKCALDADTLARQKRILGAVVAFLDKVLADGKVTAESLNALCRATRPDLLANASTAARTQLQAMHKQMLAWKKELTAEEWKSLKVIVQGGQIPRKDHLGVQYFARLLGEPGEGRRIVYAESLWEEESAVRLLARGATETRLGEAFFADGSRLHRDFLADAARVAIDDIFAAP